ncbi:MAG TPA: hypothetical protein CFH84_01010 [Sulfurimonas sp. UBA12504]|nr:MAG TPA: hypothetical protein CFH84_01010 [Sulfurimonas sp. UBA12504]
MLERLAHIIKRTKSIPNTIKQKQLTIDLIARYSNGNVSLQRGNFITSSELTKKEQVIFSHRFI